MGCRTEITFFCVKLYGSGITGGLLLSDWSLTGCAQRQLCDTEVQSELELELHIAIDDLGFLLSKLKEGSVKPEKMQERLIRLIKGPGGFFNLEKYDCKQRT